MVEPLVDDALRKSCTKHTKSAALAKTGIKPTVAYTAH
jgi:hypothetical protein